MMVRLEADDSEDMEPAATFWPPLAFSAGWPQVLHTTVRERRLYSPGSPVPPQWALRGGKRKKTELQYLMELPPGPEAPKKIRVRSGTDPRPR